MRPNYIARKSAWLALRWWCILFFFLVIPLIIQIFLIIEAKRHTYEFYDDRIVEKSGIFSIRERQSVFAGVYTVTVRQSFIGRIFGFGDVTVDCPGYWDINTCGLKNPHGLKNYLKSKITARGVNSVIVE
ncbi:MAG: PH domain-containing protein [Clostridia bacterium]|nr:PH domain-containing protein [Clostridia bacterium]